MCVFLMFCSDLTHVNTEELHELSNEGLLSLFRELTKFPS